MSDAGYKHWSLDDISWEAFDPSKVDPDLLRVVKTAALVERNSEDYVAYLNRVFPDDPQLQNTFMQWGREEAQHGMALARWAELADPDFDFDQALTRFKAGYSLPLDAVESVRGSAAGELVSRCVIESGTSSFYTAMKDRTDEPVLKEIAGHIAADEFRHYALFLNTLQDVEQTRPLSLWDRLKVAVGRVSETDDDELAYAWYAATQSPDSTYDREACAAAYNGRVMGLYQRRHTDRAASMIAKAVGVNPTGWLVRLLQPLVWRLFSAKAV